MGEDIEEESSHADEGGRHGNHDVVEDMDDLWVKQMEAKLASKFEQCQPSYPFTICKVPRDIRRVDDVAHDPWVVSIGPYHRGDESLLDMEQVKWRNLNACLGRQDGKHFNEYLKAMKEIEPRARDCYSGDINMKADEFVEMMLLDGLFIIELFSTRGNSFLSLILLLLNIHEEEPFYTIRAMLCRVGHDMLLLENQLPFFVLERLWNLTVPVSKFDLWTSACTFILDYALPFEHEWDLNLLPEIMNEDGVHHLLHLVYLLLKPTSLTRTKESESMQLESTTGSSSELSMEATAKLPAFIKKMKTLSFLPPRCRDGFRSPSGQESQSMECTSKLLAVIKKILPFLSPSESKDEAPPPTVIPSAVELDEAGVVFKCVKPKSFLEVKFEQGTMKMPRLLVTDVTKSLLRNFIAYEQCFPHQGDNITSYCSFMARLVNKPRDVEILKKSKIIENWLGSDEEVARLFNDLGKGIFLYDLKCGYLGKTYEQVTKHKPKHWPKWLAKLNQDYFSNPWTIISLIAATFVIFLTSVQTYYAAFT
ncbi:hypothetical protein AAC387_Pa03g2232 [Persea americana]